MSLDGFIAGENGELDWLSIVQKEGEDYGFQSYFDSIDTVVIGRNTYEVMKQFNPWPMSSKNCIIFSSKKESPIANEIFFSGTVEEFSSSPISQNCKHVYVDGGSLIQSFLKSQKIETLTISIIPIILGKGIPLFKGGLSPIRLQLQESKNFSSGLVQCTYKVVKGENEN